MRRFVDSARLREFMNRLGRAVSSPVRVYFAGGATAVLHGWREATVDLDLRVVPDTDEVYRALPGLKESLELNVELASPADFIPELPGWEDRSLFIARVGPVAFYHYDPYAQALAKIERGHAKDRGDVEAMVKLGLVERGELLRLFERIEPQLYRFPALDPGSFRRRVEEFAVEP